MCMSERGRERDRERETERERERERESRRELEPRQQCRDGREVCGQNTAKASALLQIKYAGRGPSA